MPPKSVKIGRPEVVIGKHIMGTFVGRSDFLRSEAAKLLRQELQEMVDNPDYNTRSRYSVQSPGGTSFITKHMEYMSNYLQMDHKQYILNLKLMTRTSGNKTAQK